MNGRYKSMLFVKIGSMKTFFLLVITVLFISGCQKVDYPPPPYMDPPLPEITLQPGVRKITFIHDHIERSFFVQVPADFTLKKNYPVVFGFKRKSQGAEVWADLLKEQIEQRQYIGVYPESIDDEWYLGGLNQEFKDDIGFVSNVYKIILATGSILPDRVYAMGFSGGGCMAHYLAVRTDIFAAIAPIAGSLVEDMFDPTAHMTSVLQIHGQQDISVPYNGGTAHYDYYFLSAQNSVKTWAFRDGCSTVASVDQSLPGAVVYNFTGCQDGQESILFSVPDSGHNVYSEYDAISLNDYIFDFFERHHK